GLLYLAFRNQDPKALWLEITKANPYIFIIVFLITFAGNLFRAARWKLLIEATSDKVSFRSVFQTLMLGYFVNFAVPRLGEISRCFALQKKENIPFNLSFGTVISERLVDLIMLVIITLITLFFQYDLIYTFFAEQIIAPVQAYLAAKTANGGMKLIIIGAVLVLGVIVYFYNKLHSKKNEEKVNDFYENAWKGITSIFHLKSKTTFFLYTLIIWICYYLSTYLWFFGYDKTLHLGLDAGFTLLVVGSLARSLPIQGQGMGAYHFLIAQALVLYGINSTHGTALAVMIYVTQTAFYLGVGAILSLITFITFRFKPAAPATQA
ncbi:MAG TPA: lysylphosphatidylglycerol synthase transmembrane domain-containing protein, partial [Cytophagaceae bacterium]